MYTEEHIDLLNRLGVLSASLLARKWKYNICHSINVLKSIVDDYENVIFKNEQQIFIEGREPAFWKTKPKKTKIKKTFKKTSKWKDITKP